MRDKRGYVAKVEHINEKKQKRREKAARLERGSPSYQFQPALLRLSVGSETPPPAFKAHERSPADHSQSATVCSKPGPAWVHSTPMTFTQHFWNAPSLWLSLCTAHVLWLTLCSVTFDILVKVWKALHTNECTKWLFGGREKVRIVWSFDIINYKAITLIFKVSSYLRFCLQSVWSSNDDDDDDGSHVKNRLI